MVPSVTPESFTEVVLMCRPDRWDNLPDAVKTQPGLYSNLMTFSAGPRVSSTSWFVIGCTSHFICAQSCIGVRFSIIEVKIFMYILITNFSFHDTGVDIMKVNV